MRLNSEKLIYNDMGSSILYYLTYLIKHAWRVKFLCHLKMILIPLYLNCTNSTSNRRPSFHPVISTCPLVFQRCHGPCLWSPAALHGPQQWLCHRPNQTSSCQPPTDCSMCEQLCTSSLQNGWVGISSDKKHSSEHQLSVGFGLFIYFKHLCLKYSVSSKIPITSISFQCFLIKRNQILNFALQHHAECLLSVELCSYFSLLSISFFSKSGQWK